MGEYHRSARLGGSGHMQGKSWAPGTFKYQSFEKHNPHAPVDPEVKRRRTAEVDEKARSDSWRKVEQTHHDAEEAEHAARSPYATGTEQAEAVRKRHEANLAHVHHADKFDSLEAHDASEMGRNRYWDSQIGQPMQQPPAGPLPPAPRTPRPPGGPLPPAPRPGSPLPTLPTQRNPRSPTLVT